MRAPALELAAVSKHFPGVVACDRVDLSVQSGTIHAVVGENGAGKTTLMRLAYGELRPDAGVVRIQGETLGRGGTARAIALGLGMVHQHFMLVPTLTVAENLVLSRASIPGVVDWKAEQKRIDDFMETTPFRVPTRKLVRQLATGEKQKLEILKQLYLGSRIVILDEPTSVLTPQEAETHTSAAPRVGTVAVWVVVGH